MATTADPEGSDESEDKALSESESESDSGSEEVFSKLSRSELESCLPEMLEKYQSLQSKYKDLKQVQVVASETYNELEKNISSLNENIFSLESNNSALKSKFQNKRKK